MQRRPSRTLPKKLQLCRIPTVAGGLLVDSVEGIFMIGSGSTGMDFSRLRMQ